MLAQKKASRAADDSDNGTPQSSPPATPRESDTNPTDATTAPQTTPSGHKSNGAGAMLDIADQKTDTDGKNTDIAGKKTDTADMETDTADKKTDTAAKNTATADKKTDTTATVLHSILKKTDTADKKANIADKKNTHQSKSVGATMVKDNVGADVEIPAMPSKEDVLNVAKLYADSDGQTVREYLKTNECSRCVSVEGFCLELL